MISSESYRKYPCFTREDFYDYMIESGCDIETAFKASEMIRKGQGYSVYFKEKFEQLNIPAEIKEIAKNYLYVFPRSHCVEFILTNARVSYYANIDSRVFSKIVYKKNH